MLSALAPAARRGVVRASCLTTSPISAPRFIGAAATNLPFAQISRQKHSSPPTLHIPAEISALHNTIKEWRQHIHQHPETAFKEHNTAKFVAEKLKSWGIHVETNVGRTGVVGTLKGKVQSNASVGLRADMDALPMEEEGNVPYRSVNSGSFHGCGHDGHTAMLLGAAKYLSENNDFAGTVHFIFQPAEEGMGGAKEMIQDGLFERFSCDRIFALHNWPSLPAGTFGIRNGAIMASCDEFQIEICGQGGHAAMPHVTVDPIVVASHVVTALQTLVSRTIDPLDSAVVSVTKFNAGTAFNVIPEFATIGGTVRTFDEETRIQIQKDLKRIVEGVTNALGATANVKYFEYDPPTVNTAEETKIAIKAAQQIVGHNHVTEVSPAMTAEDFSAMLQKKPGCYVWLGQAGGNSSSFLHNPKYDFNDSVATVGVTWFVNVVRECLGK